jgi:hypothetical protein
MSYCGAPPNLLSKGVCRQLLHAGLKISNCCSWLHALSSPLLYVDATSQAPRNDADGTHLYVVARSTVFSCRQVAQLV